MIEKRLILAIGALLISLWHVESRAVWPVAAGGQLMDNATVVKVGPASGSIYVAGSFEGLAVMDDLQLNSRGLEDLYVARLAPGGSVLWIVTAGGDSRDRVTDIALDAAENVYVTGHFYGSAFFGSTALSSGRNGVSADLAHADGFVARISNAGAWEWATDFGGAEDDFANAVEVVAGNNAVIPPEPSSVFVGGSHNCTIDYGNSSNGGGSLNSSVSGCSAINSDIFLGRLDSSGAWQYAINRAGATSAIERIEDLEAAGDGRLFIHGELTPSGLQTLVDDNFNNGAIPAHYQRSNTGRAGINQLFTADYEFYTRHGFVDVVLDKNFDFAGTQFADLSIIVRRGFDHGSGLSELPDGNENFEISFFNASGQWQLLESFAGGGVANESFSRSYTLPSSAFHTGFQIRFRQTSGSGSNFDYWHFDGVRVRQIGAATPFVGIASNTLGGGGSVSFGSFTQLPSEVQINDIHLTADTSALYLAGEFTSASNYCSAGAGNRAAFLAKLSGTNLGSCQWIESFAEAGGGWNAVFGVTTDDAGNVYAAGRFAGTVTFFNGDGGTLSATTSGATGCGATDIFAASFTSGGIWRWVTGGDFYDAADGVPGRAGGSGCDLASDIDFDGNQNLYVAGIFQDLAVFGEEQTASGRGGDDGFVSRLSTDGVWFQISGWTIGQAVPPPPNAKLDDITFQPDFFLNGAQVSAIANNWFYWAPPAADGAARLIPLRDLENIEIHWRIQGRTLQDPERIVTVGTTLWPADPCADFALEGCFQVHVAGAPVEIQPPDQSVSFLRIVVPTGGNNAAVNANVFEATSSGFSTLLYADGPSPDDTQYEGFVQVVRTLPFAAAPLFQRSVPAEIGKKILDAYHNEIGRGGYVLNEHAFYDGVGPNAAYDRDGRTGIILPVNRLLSTRARDANKELVVSWYRRKATGVYWPEKPVSYETFWPLDPDLLIIASQEGGENLGQEPLDPLVFTEASIYQQPDPGLAGYNPNDEHAFFAPSQTGTGLEAIFALRSDFGSNLAGEVSAASDPYVLVKYRNASSGEWQFRVYEVHATGAGFNNFRFDGVAGSPVAPPYPVSLLPGCGESNVVGQAVTDPQPPAPFFQDYKNQLWGTSAGSGQVRYFYPLQAGFFVDVDNDDVNDVSTGQCFPWLARLPVSLGGAGGQSEPIRVSYDIVWPDSAPQLIPGETLLTPKRGLPDIYNQAAIEIAFDQYKDENPGAEPAEALAQLLDPLNPRFVALEALPSGVASELDVATGGRVIISNASGTSKLPVSIRKRLSYDNLNGRLIFQGVFDGSGAGEPLLLLNVMSIRERDILLALDESADQNWADAIQALFRKTRNPQGIGFICTSSSIDPDSGNRVCDSSRDITDNDVLAGLQDSNNDGVLEPFQAVGVKPALTAGFSQGSGFMTLVFNNDPSLNPLPVSLQVIRIDCLQSPPPPTPPEDADILSVYQGQLQIIAPDNIFDEQVVLRHSGDFGGNPDALEFEWYFHPDIDGTPPEPLPSPETGQLSGWIQFPVGDGMGINEISIEGANIQTLSDNWYVARYRGLGLCSNTTEWSIYAGQPGGTPLEPRAQLAEGWVKRVIKRLNPFEARVQDFAQAATNNFSSMLVQLGERFEGPIALNSDPENLNEFGLIEAYTTVFRRAMTLSVDATPPVNFDPANNAILLVGSRLVDFYTLLGNEAYSDAQDPTIGITTDPRLGVESLAPTIFNFQNQLASVLEEELVLLRGRDKANGPVAASPVYNRLFWNFTTGDGEVAYQTSYNISDVNVNGVIDEFDARIQFPQGHGDAWGHYLTALDIYYDLLRHPFFSWNPRAEAITVAGAPITVDFMDERQFAETAAAKARAGAEIVDLTYRSAYVEDPAGQWQGYKDIDPKRAWGLSEWGSRSGQGAYFDWVTGNSILQVEESDPTKVGIQKVDRSTVTELKDIQAYHQAIQSQVDEADQGLNPLGLAEGVVPFDIDPSQVDAGVTHFEQIFARAETALTNAVQVWDFANSLNQMLRRNDNTVEDLNRNARASEVDFKNRLIEIFGYPYADDIGPGGLYPTGYDGPDLYHYMYVDVNALEGTAFDLDACPENATDCDPSPLLPAQIRRFNGNYTPSTSGFNFFQILGEDEDLDCGSDPLGDGCALGDITSDSLLEVEYVVQDSELSGFSFIKPPEWTSQRRAPGELQQILSEMFSARIAMERGFREYENLRRDITDQIDTIQATFDIRQEQIQISNETRKELNQLTITSQVFKNTAIATRRVGNIIENGFKTAEECVPDTFIAGFSNGGDIFAGVSCAVKGGGYAAGQISDAIADGLDIVANATESAKEDVSLQSGIESQIQDARLELFNLKGSLDQLLRKEPLLRADIYSKAQALLDLQGKYYASLAKGQRTLQQLITFRKNGAAAIQEYRYQDMAFRIFRNDALQKYRAAFDLAARYVYLAATAYDYETNLLGSNAQAGQSFLTDIVRERSIGQILDGEPVAGSRGLADPMGRMDANFAVLKGQMGFNNPQTETNRFSLRRELFRILDEPDSDEAWREMLEDARVDNLWELQEFRRFARPFAPEGAGPQPALVIRFPTTVTFGLNYFGWQLGPGDSTYDPTQFATKVRSAGVWFDQYEGLPLSNTPRVYLFPTGADVLRSPDAFNFDTREWNVIDQRIPVPFQIGSQDLENESWLPLVDTLIGNGTEIRRFSRFRAYHFSEPFDASQVVSDSRLIGRSVWNREWMMIIPGETLLFDPDEGLDTFIHGELVPGSTTERDGQGVRDILLFFQTYAYSGN